LPNPVTWFEIMGKDHQKTRDWYGSLFGWQFESMPMGEGNEYHMLQPQEGKGTGGGLGGGPQGGGPRATIFVEVDDPQAYLDKAVAAGATVVMPVTDVPGMVRFAMFADPDGIVIGMHQDLSGG
jgi:predicted enzyme related to lactoylglutathione lyase